MPRSTIPSYYKAQIDNLLANAKPQDYQPQPDVWHERVEVPRVKLQKATSEIRTYLAARPSAQRTAMGDYIVPPDGKPLTSLDWETPGPASYTPSLDFTHASAPRFSIPIAPRTKGGSADYAIGEPRKESPTDFDGTNCHCLLRCHDDMERNLGKDIGMSMLDNLCQEVNSDVTQSHSKYLAKSFDMNHLQRVGRCHDDMDRNTTKDISTSMLGNLRQEGDLPVSTSQIRACSFKTVNMEMASNHSKNRPQREERPGPGDYNVGNVDKRGPLNSPAFSMAKRLDVQDVNRTPGPAAYLPTLPESGPRFSLTCRPKPGRHDWNSPVTSAYDELEDETWTAYSKAADGQNRNSPWFEINSVFNSNVISNVISYDANVDAQ